MPAPHIPGSGLIKGLGITGKTMLKTMFPGGLKKPIPDPVGGAVTVQYPHEKEAPPTRARGVIALKEENCTSCLLCSECPDCAILEEQRPKRTKSSRGKPSKRNKLDVSIESRCACTAGSVERVPLRRLVWSQGTSTPNRTSPIYNDKALLGQWMEPVPFEHKRPGLRPRSEGPGERGLSRRRSSRSGGVWWSRRTSRPAHRRMRSSRAASGPRPRTCESRASTVSSSRRGARPPARRRFIGITRLV